MIQRIAEGFGLSEVNVEQAARLPHNAKLFNDFLGANGALRIFAFYQAPTIQSEDNPAEWTQQTDVPALFLTTGENQPILGKAVYFVRMEDASKAVDVNTGCDASVLSGELSKDMLRDLESFLNVLYIPQLKQSNEWGKASTEQRDEFLGEVDRFRTDIKETLKSLVGGVELRRPEKKFDVDTHPQGREGIRDDPEAVRHYEELLLEWCETIEEYLDEKQTEKNSGGADAGPLTEVEYWRRRMQRLTNITEQLKTKDCKNVIGILSSLVKGDAGSAANDSSSVYSLLRRWKTIDVKITEHANEAKDNEKYLKTLEKFIEPLYNAQPLQIIDTLPALMNSIKMIHTIARYYNTTERMSTLFAKITNQMIVNCRQYVTQGQRPSELWDRDPQDLVKYLEACLKLNEAYQEQYRLTKDKLLTMPKGKQFDFNETQIFGKFDLFCRRCIKLIDMFSTIFQFQALAGHNLEGMESLIKDFQRVIETFKGKQKNDLLEYQNNKFDRDYVEFNVKISDLEGALQQFINQSFENITNIENSLNLLKKFQNILQRENLKNDLDDKFNIIFQNYGVELEQVQHLYEKHKHAPPLTRNLPPVAGNITWSRHLLKRIEEPMKRFETNQNVLSTKDAKKIIKTYNKVARTLVAFEYLWYRAWIDSIETSKAGLQATLIIRHPEDGRLYVNFDQEILQLIREAKCLDRMGIDIPENAKIVLLQEEKFKAYYNDLAYALREYERVAHMVIPVTTALLRPHINDMEYKLRPGMITLTWTSMNIDAYKHHVHTGLQKLEELVHNINDIIENRIEKNLKTVSKSLLVDLPADRSFTLEDFVMTQEQFIDKRSSQLQGKNVQVENAVEDLIEIITTYALDPHIEPVSPEDVDNLRKHYNHFMYQALLNCTKNSLNSVKKRVGSRGGGTFLFVERPFFDVDVQLAIPAVRLSPSLEDIQKAINKAAGAVLRCTKNLYDWGQQDMNVANRVTFFHKIAKDIEIVRVVLLLTGSIQGLKNQVSDYLQTFIQYDWLWKEDKDAAYNTFIKTKPALDDYRYELKRFVVVEKEIKAITGIHIIGALSLDTKNLKLQLMHEAGAWKVAFSENLHIEALEKMNALNDYMKVTDTRLKREVVDLDSLRYVMNVLKEIRERESGIDMEIVPVMDMYEMLEQFLPEGYMDTSEMDQKSVIRSTWKRMVNKAEVVTDDLGKIQHGFKKQLLKDVRVFVTDVLKFRTDFVSNGPGEPGIDPNTAVERLKRFKDQFDIFARKEELYSGGEELFALKPTPYPELVATKKEIGLQETLYGLYVDVHEKVEVEWPHIQWSEVQKNMDTMTERVENFMARLSKMPRVLRTWPAYESLKKKLEDFGLVLPILEQLSKDSIKPRHWTELMQITGKSFTLDDDFRLKTLLACQLENHAEDLEELTDGADKQLAIEQKILEINGRWSQEEFDFQPWKSRGVPILRAVGPIIEELEESQMQCQTMLTMRHVKPFKEEVSGMLTRLSDTSETLERWLKVQQLWCSLESVFTGGDIAKQMPVEAKKFVKLDKDWAKLMAKASETCLVLECCENEQLRTLLPVMYEELERCQKALDGYLEQKRGKFPRFYFVSNPVLLQILSQGSDPMAIQPYYQTVFDAIEQVLHDETDKRKIHTMVSRFKGVAEEIPFQTVVNAVGNIEDWLATMKQEQCFTMKDICRRCAEEIEAGVGVDSLRSFVDNMPPQYALLGIQLLWTMDTTTALDECRVKKSGVGDCSKKQTAILAELSSWCLEELPDKVTRTKYECLVTIQVHQRDVNADINTLFKQKKIHNAQDFEWLKQARFYWQPEEEDTTDEDGKMCISVTNVDFMYMYEYLGCKGRLVITPLTDRCYITLSQAMGMFLGGAPAGPAGTGKTETVKDMGRSLGIYVIVTNCTDQASYTSMGKIFKGLCMAGLWGCFDEFNRIKLPVLSVVAAQCMAILDAKRLGQMSFYFPGDPQKIGIDHAVNFFITMNPGYAGRQELPENLKALFRGVTMMVPDREIIIRVLLCAVGYDEFVMLSKKFTVLYQLSEEQLSKQRHYDFGLRNILSVLRTAGKTKRDNRQADESELLYQTLRDMNMSKMVAQDVPLFLSLLKDLFPKLSAPAVAVYKDVEDQVDIAVENAGLIKHKNWLKKVVQLYETVLVRHGIMVIGPTGGGKTEIFTRLRMALAEVYKRQYREARLNPKAILATQMYGEVDPLSDEWTTGVFAATWAKYNKRENPYDTWIICDGPVDAIWIEDLNTVLDDNRILTLANGDRIPMTDNTKIMFENETLVNASPATVSRCGIIYVGDTELGWTPLVQAWTQGLSNKKRGILLMDLFIKYIGTESQEEPGHMFEFLIRDLRRVMPSSFAGVMASCINLMNGLFSKHNISDSGDAAAIAVEKLLLYAITWSLGGLLEDEDRKKFDTYLRDLDKNGLMPTCEGVDTIYEMYVNTDSNDWSKWQATVWNYPDTETLDFSNILVPTMDSVRALYVIELMHSRMKPVLLTGGPGTAKTSAVQMFAGGFDPNEMTMKTINFSSASTMLGFQVTIESCLDKRGGKTFGPPNGRKLTVFIDDISMPEINEWGDQPTVEIVRQIVETNAMAFLDKDKRGDMRLCEDLTYIACMTHPGGGRNDIPERLKRHWLLVNLVLPALESINDMFGQMLKGRFPSDDYDSPTNQVINKLTEATIALWNTMKTRMLPTPAKFHYVFNMRELSRVFQGLLLTPKDTLSTGGLQDPDKKVAVNLLRLWKHENERVFCDKLTNDKDKTFYKTVFSNEVSNMYGDTYAADVADERLFVDFFRDDVYDEDDNIVELSPKVYEAGGSLPNIRERVQFLMGRYNIANPATQLNLVLFDDALRHMMRISRIIQMPRGSALLVGVGGSGKQSLTRLAAFIGRHYIFQIALTKNYNRVNMLDDLRELYKTAGTNKDVTFLFTDAEIKSESFLEVINSSLLTGEVGGLFSKEEMMGATAEISGRFEKERPHLLPSPDNLARFFIETVRDRLHFVLCMSPVNPLFPVRARKFPGLVSCCTIDWFLPWPEEALVTVSKGLISDYPVECTDKEKDALMTHMGAVHNMATIACSDYFKSMRRNVYQTPKSFLSFIADFKGMYGKKLAEVKKKAANINLGLRKLKEGAEDVEAMKIVLREEQAKLAIATEETNKMLGSLEISSLEAKRESDLVSGIKDKCEKDAKRIAGEKSQCMAELAEAQPHVDAANKALDSIRAQDIGEVKVLKKPSDIIKLTFDCVLVLFHQPMEQVKNAKFIIKKEEVSFIQDSFGNAGKMMADTQFLNHLKWFGKEGKDLMNGETVEFLMAYMKLENFNAVVAKSASSAAEGLCKFVTAMKFYYEASKMIKPKLEALAIAEGQLKDANKKLAAAEKRLAVCQGRLNELTETFEKQMAQKQRIEDGARALERKMDMASKLITGLADEQIRWTEDSKTFAEVTRRLVGDCAVACAFVSYCGAFNQEKRTDMINEKFKKDCQEREIPVSPTIDVTSFLVDIGTIGDWNQQGLPTDQLSIQNGILVTRSSRYPLMVDPQAQAIGWIRNKEKDRVPTFGETAINNPKLKDRLEFCMSEGKALIIVGVEEDIDPLLNPVMEKQIVKKGRNMFITVADQQMDFDPNFMMYFVTRLPNPHFTPELQARTAVVDFTVTMKGLEDQLLGRVIGKEQRALQDQLDDVLSDVNNLTKSLMVLDQQLLDRLSSNEGNLLDDVELIGVLANTKAKAIEVKTKLVQATQTKIDINEKREQFRPVATRGSVLYFSVVETSLMNVMYQTSLMQFMELFMSSMDKSEKANLASKRVENIIYAMTYIVYRYINRGLYEEDKMTFVLIVTLKILVTAGRLQQSDVALLLRGGAALDINSVRKKPFAWLPDMIWLNALEVSTRVGFFRSLPEDLVRNEAEWKIWFECNDPDKDPVPDYEGRLTEEPIMGSWYRLLIVRMFRQDRARLSIQDFIRQTPAMGNRYVDPVTDTLLSIVDEMKAEIPVIFLLSIGADPTEALMQLCRKKKTSCHAISMGEGQRTPALDAISVASEQGTWVLLQNCELGLDLMVDMEDLMKATKFNEDFRLFITAAPEKTFPLGLLQMSTKVTNDPPSGLRAGLMRSYATIVDQDRIERIETPLWRKMLFTLCFLHSIVQERRKFGPLGWCIPYEYNVGDLAACIMFLEQHLYTNPHISYGTVQYMVSEIQYGGKITDQLDRVLFNTYAEKWLTPEVLDDNFMFNPVKPLAPIPNDFVYKAPNFEEHAKYADYCASFPEMDSPEIGGLHPNADLTFRLKEVVAMFNALLETQPKSGGGGDGRSREDIVYEMAAELLTKVPEDFVEVIYMKQIRSLGGLDVPLNVVLFQEVTILQRVIMKVRHTLHAMRQAIDGEVVMTQELLTNIGELFNSLVPQTWVFAPSGDEFSWISSTVGLWFGMLQNRYDQNSKWLTSGRPVTFWMHGFANPQGFLTSMKQEVTRKHRNDGWALDDVIYHTEVTDYERVETVGKPPKEGVYVNGLFLDGCAYSRHDKSLVESEPKKLFAPLPVLYVSGTTKSLRAQRIKSGAYGPNGPYSCPLYRYPARTGRYFICQVDLPSKAVDGPAVKPKQWVLRGVGLVITTDYA